jgi:SAM-dependent methyltransferase
MKMNETQVLQFERTEVIRCPLCGSESQSHHFFESVNGPDGGDVYRLCDRCGLVFQSPRMTERALSAFYKAEYRQTVQGEVGPTEKDLRIQSARARNLLKFSAPILTEIGRCLDIGSSSGILLKTFRDEYGCEGVGIEPGEAYANHCRTQGFKVVQDIEELDPVYAHSFDLVTMGHTLEHLPDPLDYLVKLRADWLAPHGHLLVEVPNLYGHHALERAHLIAFSKETLIETIRQAGYEIIRLKVHGFPRSRLIPLYITLLASSREHLVGIRELHSDSRWVKARRRVGMGWRRIVESVAPGWAWLPWPEVE